MGFQFHKGAIRTPGSSSALPMASAFQFHKGAIRTPLLISVNAGNKHFNSIKVRLEPAGSVSGSVPSTFQFHKGAIRTCV